MGAWGMSKSNEPAFPLENFITPLSDGPDGFKCRGPIGLTKRELIAAMAMQGMCANSIPGSHHHFNNTARESVEYADALLAELAKKDETK